MDSVLAPLLALAGQCFAANIATDTRDEHCFLPMYDGQHVRDIHIVTKAGRTVYRGETIYSIEGGSVVFTYFSSTGGIGRGTAVFKPTGWQFTMTMRATPSAVPLPIAVRWKWQGRNVYTVTGGPAPVTYRRSGVS